MRLVEAMFWEELKEGKVRCLLCPHHCVIDVGKTGICRVRKNVGGKLYTLVYGIASAIAVDPIEKKPLYHFRPGSYALSLSTWGCNFRCPHCQNWEISQNEPLRHYSFEISPEEVLSRLRDSIADGVSWTYNEPTIWYEFIYDASRLIKENDAGYVTLVTNGYICKDPFEKLAPYIDAMNIDYKGPEKAYRQFGGRLEPVKETIERAYKKGIHIELTYLVIPTINDSDEDFREFIDFVSSLDPEIPVHFTRFFPHYKMRDLPPTPLERLLRAYELAKNRLSYVYIGNVLEDRYNNTYCPNCGKLLIERWGFSVIKNVITEEGRCPYCGRKINVR